MQIPPPHSGKRLIVNRKTAQFGLWPTRVGEKGNHSLQPLLFSLDPWAIIERAIVERCPEASRSEAFACLEQSRDFYESATQSKRMASRPLTLYYCFMNLVKAFCLTRGTQVTFDKAQHGLSEQLTPGWKELVDAFLRAFPSPNSKNELQNFAEFKFALAGQNIVAPINLKLPELLPQIVPGHRLWVQASRKKERFIAFHDIQLWSDSATKKIWLKLYFIADDFHRLGMKFNEFLKGAALDSTFRQVQCQDTFDGRKIICFGQTTPFTYTGNKPANELHQVINPVKSFCGPRCPRYRLIADTTHTYAPIANVQRYYLNCCQFTQWHITWAQLHGIAHIILKT